MDVEQGGFARAGWRPTIPAPRRFGSARPSEVDERWQTTANAETSTCRSTAVWLAARQLATGEHHIYDI
jgi:hypothetical protein